MKFLLLIALVFSCNKEPAKSLTQKIAEHKQASTGKIPEEIKELFAKATDDLAKTGIAENALSEGNKLPNFEILSTSGEKVMINTLYEDKYLVIDFYRGGWCPYCKLELQTYQELLEDFIQAGARVIAISPDTVLESKKTKDKNKLSFELYSDPNNEAAKKLGLAFQVDSKVIEVYKKFGIDLEASQGNSENTLPMPGTYVVDKSGKIVFAFLNPDYTMRAEPSEVLEIVKGLK